ncbi:MAG: hypothetical protein U9Q90_03880, partial [Campylobacterota bacterium]|nr:hypothetical protein [Campylobacterota bacterium]
MKRTQKLLILIIGSILLCGSTISLLAKDTATVYAENEDISRNLDLNAVASIFGESRDLEDFERRLNDPDIRTSNLDLNGDGRVDYLRVVETMEGAMHLIAIQAVIGYDSYQDVATIEVEKDYRDNAIVQVVGDPYLYGPSYIIEPIYLYTPIIYGIFWGAVRYRPYYSHYRWGYYPRYYRPWRPRPVPYYHNYLRRHVNDRNYYRRADTRKNHNARQMHNRIRKNDYAIKHPNRSYTKRQKRMHTAKQRDQVRQQKATGNIHHKSTTGKSVQRKNVKSRQRNYDRTRVQPHTTSGKQNLNHQRRTQTRSVNRRIQSTRTTQRHTNRRNIQSKSLSGNHTVTRQRRTPTRTVNRRAAPHRA